MELYDLCIEVEELDDGSDYRYMAVSLDVIYRPALRPAIDIRGLKDLGGLPFALSSPKYPLA